MRRLAHNPVVLLLIVGLALLGAPVSAGCATANIGDCCCDTLDSSCCAPTPDEPAPPADDDPCGCQAAPAPVAPSGGGIGAQSEIGVVGAERATCASPAPRLKPTLPRPEERCRSGPRSHVRFCVFLI